MPIARKCPNCGSKMYVNYTDPKKDGLDRLGVHDKVIRRRIECDNCGLKMTTYEISADALKQLKKARHETIMGAKKIETVLGIYETANRNCRSKLRKIHDNLT